MTLPEHFKQVSKANLSRVKDHQNDLVMSGLTRAHLTISGVRRVPRCIPYRCSENTRDFPEDTLGAPETAQTKHRYFK